MARRPRSLIALALATAAGLTLAACGSEDAQLLPGETAREIIANLDTVQQLSDEGDCVGADSAAEQVGEQIEGLKGVDPKLKRALEDGAVRLEEVIAGCEESTEEAIAPAEVPTEIEEDEEKPPKEKKPKPEKAGKPDETPASPSLPPQAKGKAKGHEGEEVPPPAEEEGGEEEGGEGESGGVSPGSVAGEGK